MTWSLNEIEALSRRAARGARYSWGLAEEAGRAVRWLEARQLPGAEALARHLQAVDGQDLASFTPDAESWTAPGGRTCPILAGTMLADGMAGDRSGTLTISHLSAPLLLLPFLAWAAEARGHVIGLETSGGTVALSADGTLTGSANGISHDCASVSLNFSARSMGQAVAEGLRSACSAETFAALSSFAGRTYAPATEESRLAGAGAGLTDND